MVSVNITIKFISGTIKNIYPLGKISYILDSDVKNIKRHKLVNCVLLTNCAFSIIQYHTHWLLKRTEIYRQIRINIYVSY